MAARRAVVAAAALALASCVPRSVVPLRTIRHPAGPAPSKTLVVLLPGRFDDARDFERRGFVAAAREAGLDADLVAVEAHFGYYRKAELARRLHEDVIAPSRARGVATVWAVGISLGGLGAIMSLERYPGDLDGALLIAPYLGGDRAKAGDPAARIWSILQDEIASGRPLWLGFGTDDGMAPAHHELARALPPEHVLEVPGKHDWPPWSQVWRWFLRSGPIARRPFTEVSPVK